MDSTLVFNFGIGIVIILFVFFVLCMSGVQKDDFCRLFIHMYHLTSAKEVTIIVT